MPCWSWRYYPNLKQSFLKHGISNKSERGPNNPKAVITALFCQIAFLESWPRTRHALESWKYNLTWDTSLIQARSPLQGSICKMKYQDTFEGHTTAPSDIIIFTTTNIAPMARSVFVSVHKQASQGKVRARSSTCRENISVIAHHHSPPIYCLVTGVGNAFKAEHAELRISGFWSKVGGENI